MKDEESTEEYRRIQVTGGSTYIISLPKPWMDQLGLTRGSLVSLTLKRDQTLVLQSKDRESPEKNRRVTVTLEKSDSTENAIRKLIAVYLLGYTIIELRSTGERIDPSLRAGIKGFTRKKLVGTEIVNDFPNTLTLQILLNYTDLSVTDALQRMSLIAASMHRDAIAGLTSDNNQLLKEVVGMDDEVDRFSFYVIRLVETAVTDHQLLEETGIKSPRLCIGYRLIAKNVERLADHAVKIAENQLALKNLSIDAVVASRFSALSASALNIFEEAMNALFHFDYSAATKVLDGLESTREMEGELVELISKQGPSEQAPSLRLMADSLLRTAEYGSDIAEIVLNMTVHNIIEK